MPVVRVSREVAVERERVWELVSDPHSLPRWWPKLQRVEEASPEAWTKVLMGDRGKPIRADFTRASAEPPRRHEWRQEVAETPFERFLSEARLAIELEPAADGTRVELISTERLRGLARLGGLLVRRAGRRRLHDALDGIELALGASGERSA